MKWNRLLHMSEHRIFLIIIIIIIIAISHMHRNRQKAACASSWIYIDTIFTARRYGPNRGLCCRPVSVHPSVCLSVCHVGALYPDGWRYRQTSFTASVARPIILVFMTPSACTHFQGNPFRVGAKYTGVGKICDFRPKSPFISETVDPWLLWNFNKSYR